MINCHEHEVRRILERNLMKLNIQCLSGLVHSWPSWLNLLFFSYRFLWWLIEKAFKNPTIVIMID